MINSNNNFFVKTIQNKKYISKFVCILTLLLLVVLLPACTNNSSSIILSDSDENIYKNKNGVYRVTYDYTDSNGWIPFLLLIIDNERIVSAKMDYKDKDGNLKSEDFFYSNEMKKTTGISPKEAFNELELRFLEKQRIAYIDTVSGATDTSLRYIQMVSSALETTSKDTLILKMNDIYKGSEENFDSHGWKASINIQIENDIIIEVDYDEFNKDGVSKKDDADYQFAMSETSDTTPAKYTKLLEDQLVDLQFVGDVDIISGATLSSVKFKNIADSTLNKRVKNPDI